MQLGNCHCLGTAVHEFDAIGCQGRSSVLEALTWSGMTGPSAEGETWVNENIIANTHLGVEFIQCWQVSCLVLKLLAQEGNAHLHWGTSMESSYSLELGDQKDQMFSKNYSLQSLWRLSIEHFPEASCVFY